tara:strand:+ start:541 stop:720 length:180 start_codon:yes stop_codon:yes gene_type:complete
VGKAAGGGERETAMAVVAKRTVAKRKDCAPILVVADWVETAVDRHTQTWPNLVCISPDR